MPYLKGAITESSVLGSLGKSARNCLCKTHSRFRENKSSQFIWRKSLCNMFQFSVSRRYFCIYLFNSVNLLQRCIQKKLKKLGL